MEPLPFSDGTWVARLVDGASDPRVAVEAVLGLGLGPEWLSAVEGE